MTLQTARPCTAKLLTSCQEVKELLVEGAITQALQAAELIHPGLSQVWKVEPGARVKALRN